MNREILILDDDEDFNALLTDIFSQANYSVTSVRDPEEAIKAFKHSTFSLVVSDYRMPHLTGKEFFLEIRKINRETPVVMVSGFLDEKTTRELEKEGIGAVFLKPLKIFSLLRKTEELIAAADAKRERGSAASIRKNNFGRDVSFPFSSFPCKSKASFQFAQKIHSLRNFKSNLILVGEKGTHFKSICQDLVRFGKAERGEGKEELLIPSRDPLSEPMLFSQLEKMAGEGVSTATLAFFEAEQLRREEIELLYRIAGKIKPFEAMKTKTRFVFSFHDEPEALYDREIIDETFYIFLGPAEVAVPCLRDCQEDLPFMAREILGRIMEKTGPKFNFQLTPEAAEFIQGQPWRENYRELEETLCAVMASKKDAAITPADLAGE